MTTTVRLSRSPQDGKRLVAKFPDKTIHFGSSAGQAFVDHKDPKIRSAWLARHRVSADFADYRTAGALARWILWEKPTIAGAVRHLNQKQSEYKFVLRG